jgi:two-component system, NtrC family, sensor kinase
MSDGSPLHRPDAQALLDAVLRLSREVHLEMDEGQIAGRFLDVLSQLFPGRALAIRCFDVRYQEPARVYAQGGQVRRDLAAQRVTVKQTAIQKTRVKKAVAHSARLRVGGRWDAPFFGLPIGFTVPLVASGEIYGVLDVGYPPGIDLCEDDEALVLPIANHLSIVLRNERLHRETMVLRDYLATLIEHANALIIGVDRRWRITVCNQALCTLTGARREEVLGTDLRDWLPARDRQRMTMLIRGALTGKAAETVEAELTTATGVAVRTLWSVAPISRNGEVDAVVAVGQDQTRVRELQSQVIQAEKLATLGQLAAGVVHELNNPLTSISIYADYLVKKVERAVAGESAGLDPQDLKKLRAISASADRIMSFARDLVQYAKPARADFQQVALDQVVEQSLSFCEYLFGQHRVELIRQIASDMPPVAAVPGQLEQVVINLVTNAVHATASKTGGRVWVSAFANSDGRAVVRIEDNGPGIAPGAREQIFEPFYTTKYDGAGTGLGLSIVKNIVEQHRGQISVGESAHGGAGFTILLPPGPSPSAATDPGPDSN